MKVAMWYNNKDIRLEEVPTPKPGPKEMLVRVESCGICGSDVVEWYRLPRAPLVQGHELGAKVVEVGSEVTGYKPGDRVFIAPKVPCHQCSYCMDGHFPQCSEIKERLPGGYAEFILVPQVLIENGTYLLPEAVSYDQSTFIEPLACVVRAQRLAGLKRKHTMLVLGSGMSGLLHLRLAKTKGSKAAVTDINRKKLDIAGKSGADLIIDASDDILDRLTETFHKKADVVMLCTSALSAVQQAWRCVDKGGAVVFFAVPGPEKKVDIPINDLWTKEVRILTSYYCGPPDIREALRLLSEKKIVVDDMITHRFPLDDIQKGFQLVLDGNEAVKVIIKPHGTG